VKTNLSEQDLIVMKLDIEGAEYNVLEKMINDGSIDYINTLFVEWHDYQLKDKKIETEKIKSILKEKKIECIDWH
jgi:sacsin